MQRIPGTLRVLFGCSYPLTDPLRYKIISHFFHCSFRSDFVDSDGYMMQARAAETLYRAMIARLEVSYSSAGQG